MICEQLKAQLERFGEETEQLKTAFNALREYVTPHQVCHAMIAVEFELPFNMAVTGELQDKETIEQKPNGLTADIVSESIIFEDEIFQKEAPFNQTGFTYVIPLDCSKTTVHVESSNIDTMSNDFLNV